MEDQLDEAALEQLYQCMERRLYNVAYRWVWNAHDAQELVQETFLRLWKMRTRVEMRTVEPLVYRIALNLARKRARRRKVLRWVGLGEDQVLDEQDGAESQLVSRQLDAEVREAIERLPDHYREVILMCEFSEMTYAEIASALKIKSGTVASRRHEAISRLRESLKDWNPREVAS